MENKVRVEDDSQKNGLKYEKLWSIALLVWFVQTSILAVYFLAFLASFSSQFQNQDYEFRSIILFLDFPVFLYFIVLAFFEFANTLKTSNSKIFSGQIAVGIGSFIFLSAALAYRSLSFNFPENFLSTYFIQLYDLDKYRGQAFNSLNDELNGLIIANWGLLLVVIGFSIFIKKGRVALIVYGLLNLFLVYTVLLAFFKPIVSAPFLGFAAYRFRRGLKSNSEVTSQSVI